MIIWVMKIFFVQFFCVSWHLFLVSSASFRSIPFLSFIEPIFVWNVPLVSNFPQEISSFLFYCFPLFLCPDHCGRLSYLSLLFFGTRHSDGYIFPTFLCLSLLFYSQLFVRPPQTTVLPFCIFFLGDGLDHCLLYNVMILHPYFFRHSITSNPLNLFVTSTV